MSKNKPYFKRIGKTDYLFLETWSLVDSVINDLDNGEVNSGCLFMSCGMSCFDLDRISFIKKDIIISRGSRYLIGLNTGEKFQVLKKDIEYIAIPNNVFDSLSPSIKLFQGVLGDSGDD